MAQLTYFCWRCNARNERCCGGCGTCGQEIAAPSDTSYTEQLIWSLGHPMGAIQMIAAKTLGERGDHEAVPALERLVDGSNDPFLGAEALSSLVAIEGVADRVRLLEELRESGAAPVAEAARQALAKQ